MTNKLWLKAGKLVLAAGKAVLCGNCPCNVCCGATYTDPGTVPATLHLTLTGTSCVDGTYPTVFVPGNPYFNLPQPVWASAVRPCLAPFFPGNHVQFLLHCVGFGGTQDWGLVLVEMQSGQNDIRLETALTGPASCDPSLFQLAGTGVHWLPSPATWCCDPSVPFNATVTP